MENIDTKKYMPYGVAALGGVIGFMLHKKFPKFGNAGKVGYVAIGALGGYFLTKMIVDKGAFSNAVGGGIIPSLKMNEKQCEKACFPNGGDVIDGKCVCYRIQATREFSNAVDTDTNPRKRYCKQHKRGDITCGYGLRWDEASCSCVAI